MSFIRKFFSLSSSSTANGGHNTWRFAMLRNLFLAAAVVFLGLFPAEALANSGMAIQLATASALAGPIEDYRSNSGADSFILGFLKGPTEGGRANAAGACGIKHKSRADADLKKLCLDAVAAAKATKPPPTKRWCCLHEVYHSDRARHSCPEGQECINGKCIPIDPCKGVKCDDGESCNPETGECEPDGPECGDEEVEGDEVCDDGNTDDGDWCNADCTDETMPWWVWVLIVCGSLLGAVLLGLAIWLLFFRDKKVKRKVKKDAGGDTGGYGDGLVDCARDGCVGRGVPGEYCGKCRDQLSVPPTLTPAVTQVAGAAPVSGAATVDTQELLTQLEDDIQRQVTKAQVDATIDSFDRQMSINSNIITALEGGTGDPREDLLAVHKAANEALQSDRAKASELSASLDEDDES